MIASFRVLGVPETQGSKTAVMRGGRAHVIEGSNGPKRQRFVDWRQAVRSEGQRWQEDQGNPGLFDGPLIVNLAFGLAKPASAPKTRRTWPIKAQSGDIDKLARCVLDALTGVLFADDSQVVALASAKDFSEQPGLTVLVRTFDADIDALDPAWNLRRNVSELTDAPA